MNANLKETLTRVKANGWSAQASQLLSGNGTEIVPLRICLGDLERRKPRLRKKTEVAQIEADIRTVRQALAEVEGAQKDARP